MRYTEKINPEEFDAIPTPFRPLLTVVPSSSLSTLTYGSRLFFRSIRLCYFFTVLFFYLAPLSTCNN